MKYVKVLAIVALLFATAATSVRSAVPDAGLRHVFDIHARCDRARDMGAVPGGKRVMIPITGGSVEGGISADILPGGADYQMIDTVSGRVELDASYTILTSDSCLINVRNIGVNVADSCGYYFATSPKFEAPVNSRYNWLNNRIFVCKPSGFGDGIVHLSVWALE